MRKPHPADLANAAIVEIAIRYRISLFRGAGQYETHEATTLDEARRIAASLNGTRRPLIYGIDANGRAGLVTETMKEQTMSTKTKRTADDFAAEMAAKKVAAPKPAKATKPAKAAKAKKPAKAPKAAKPTKAPKANGKPAARPGTKAETVLAMLKKGATRKAIVEATGWQVDLKQFAERKGLKLSKDAEGVITAS